MKKIIAVFVFFQFCTSLHAQLKVGANPTTINSNSILELESTNKGLLLPRLALSSTNSASPLSSFVAGMVVYNTATANDVTPGFYVSNGSSWSKIDNQTTVYNGSTSVTLNGSNFERAALTGDVTAAANSNATTISNSAVTYAKMQNVSANNKLLGRATTGAGTVEEITLGTGLSLSGTTLNAATATTLYNGDGSIPASTTRAVSFGSAANLNFDANTFYISGDNNNVGIGTTSPSGKLDVAGGAIRIDQGKTLTTNPSDNFTYNAQSMSHYGIGWYNDSWDNSGATSWLSSYAGVKFFTNGTARVALTRSGNLGINTMTPSEKLEVAGNIRFSGALMPNNTAGTSGQVLTSAGAGAVPTWTTLPTATTYSGSTSVALNGTSFERAALTGDVTAAANSNATTIATDAVTSTKILDGTISTADLANNAVTFGKIQNISANNILLGRATTGAGTVEEITLGSGLSLSGTTLSASGDLRLVNVTSHVTQDAGVGSNGSSAGGADNILIGSGAGNANAGTKNVYIGKEAGNANTSSSGSTFIGYQTGKTNTTGGANTYLGYQSGTSGSTNSANTFVGYQSGNSNTGDNNNAFGYLALKQNTTGGGNAAFGTQSLMSNTTGFENTALGTYSLFNTTTGALNVASGARSMMSNTTGSYNTANGYQSATANTTGNNNTAFGSQALYTNSTGNNNVSLGVQSLKLATSSNNIAIGYYAGDNITTGSKNLIIGYDIDAPSATTSNQLNIGNIIFGNNIDGSATTLSTGNIGIGTNAPSEKLEVAGNIRFSGALMPNNTAGTSGQVLTSAGAGAVPTWTTLPTATTYTGSTSVALNGTSFERAALTGDVTAAANSNATTIATDAVTSTKILDGTITTADLADASITAAKLNQMAATSGQVLKWNGTTWAPASDNNTIADGSETIINAGSNISISGSGTTGSPYVINASSSIATITADYTATSANNTILCNVPVSGLTLTLPTASSNAGKVIVIRKIDNDSDAITFSPAINYSTTQTIASLNFVKTLTIQSNGTSWWIISE